MGFGGGWSAYSEVADAGGFDGGAVEGVAGVDDDGCDAGPIEVEVVAVVAVDDGGVVAGEWFGGDLEAEGGDAFGGEEGVVALDVGAEGLEFAEEVDGVGVVGDGDVGAEGEAEDDDALVLEAAEEGGEPADDVAGHGIVDGAAEG